MTSAFSVKAKNIDGMNCEFTLADDSDDKLLIRVGQLFIWLKDAGFEAYFPPVDKVAKAEPVGVPVDVPKGVDITPPARQGHIEAEARKQGAKGVPKALAVVSWCEECGEEKTFKLRHGANGDFYSHAFQVNGEWVYHSLREV